VSRVLLGRATRCVGTAAAALPLLCYAGPALGMSSAPVLPDGAALSGSLPFAQALAARLPSVPSAPARLRASASRACPNDTASVRDASAGELRSALICLVNRFRGRAGLPPLEEQNQLDSAAQGHDDQMVSDRYFGHGGAGGPSLRISAAGFKWGAYGEAISTGFRTPHRAVAAWLRSAVHCQILLSPEYRYIGVGVNPSPVPGSATSPGTWTADLALPLGWAAPSRKWAPANGCPY
jgi:uncharacterized protein YkwD